MNLLTTARRLATTTRDAVRSVVTPAALVLRDQAQPAATTVMSFPTRKGAVVEVTSTATGSDSYPMAYRWECSAGHRSDSPHSYAGLPFARRDAEAHAAVCRKRPKRGIARQAPAASPDPDDTYNPEDMPAIADIERAALSYDLAVDNARRADRTKRAAKKVLDKVPTGIYGRYRIFRTPSSRQTPDLAEITRIFKANGLGPVPMKDCAPSLKVELLATVPADIAELVAA